jgi:hypothetical protein
MYNIYNINNMYKFLTKKLPWKICFGFIGMNTSVQGRPPFNHYSSFQSISFLKKFLGSKYN